MTDQHPLEVAVIPGDGIGPEVVEAARAVLEATGAGLSIRCLEAGDETLERRGTALPDESLEGARRADAVLFGASGNSGADVILRLRRELGTYVSLRPIRAFQGVKCLYPEANLVIVRENTEGLYAGIENEIAPGVVTATRVITRTASQRIAEFAFRHAEQEGFEKVTAVHKANVLNESDGLFLQCARAAAQGRPSVRYDEVIVDAAALHLVLMPERFQVLLTPNLYGDILSDLAAGLIGGLGLCPSANLGERHALFEPVHGSAPDIAGKGIANPTAAILCASMLLRHVGEREASERVENALQGALAAGRTTPDLGGELSTREMTEEIIQRLEGAS